MQWGRAVGVLSDDVAALVHEGLGGVALLGRVVPAVDHHELQPRLGIDRAHAEHEGVQALHDLWHGERADVAGQPGRAHHTRDHALDVAGLVKADVVRADVGCALVAGCMLEPGIRVPFRGIDRVVHVAERRGEDQFVTAIGEVIHDALGVRTFGHVLDEGRLDLIAEMLGGGEAGLVVLVGPAEIADRAEVDEADLHRICGLGPANQARHAECGGTSGGQRDQPTPFDDHSWSPVLMTAPGAICVPPSPRNSCGLARVC